MNRTLLRLVSKTHLLLYRVTGGRLGGTAFGSHIVLLTTTGRKSGRRRTTPLLSLQDGENTVVVASNGGSDRHPAWWLNLEEHPDAELQVGKVKRRVRAERANDEDRSRLWPLAVELYPAYEKYQNGTERKIPVVILRSER